MAEKEQGKLVPTNEEGKPVELNEEQQLMNMTKKELVERIQKEQTKHKKVLTRSKNQKEKIDELTDEVDNLTAELDEIKTQQEDTHREAAQMSETIRMKNSIINEVTESYLALANTMRTAASQGLKILEYNGLVTNPNQTRKGDE